MVRGLHVPVPSLTTFPSWLNALMCPFTDPMQMQASEQEGEEKRGTPLECVHKTSPLSYKTNPLKRPFKLHVCRIRFLRARFWHHTLFLFLSYIRRSELLLMKPYFTFLLFKKNVQYSLDTGSGSAPLVWLSRVAWGRSGHRGRRTPHHLHSSVSTGNASPKDTHIFIVQTSVDCSCQSLNEFPIGSP